MHYISLMFVWRLAYGCHCKNLFRLLANKCRSLNVVDKIFIDMQYSLRLLCKWISQFKNVISKERLKMSFFCFYCSPTSQTCFWPRSLGLHHLCTQNRLLCFSKAFLSTAHYCQEWVGRQDGLLGRILIWGLFSIISDSNSSFRWGSGNG